MCKPHIRTKMIPGQTFRVTDGKTIVQGRVVASEDRGITIVFVGKFEWLQLTDCSDVEWIEPGLLLVR